MQLRRRTPLAEPRNILWIGLTIISVTLFVAVVQVGLSIRDLQFQLALVEQRATNGGNLSPAQIRGSLASAKNDMIVIRSDAAWLLPVLPAFGWLPQFGGDLSQAERIFGMSESLVFAADALLEGWTPVLEAHAANPSGPAPAGLDQILSDARPAFMVGRSYMARADSYRALIQQDRLSARTAALLDRLDRVLPLLHVALEGSLDLPSLVGTSEPRKYLVVAQNEDERRATGGFISAAGLLTVENGRVTGLEFTDSYDIDDPQADFPQPPEPIQTYMLSGYWLFRDANWSPDFPASARQLVTFYELGKHQHVDGVIAVDQEFVRLLVTAMGSIDVQSDPPVTVTGDNLLNYMRESWTAAFVSKQSGAILQRKNFIGQLAKAMQERIMAGDQLSTGGLAKAVYDALRGRHLLIYLPNSTLAPALASTGWDGAVGPHAGDYAMVVDSNLGFNKANALVTQAYTYSVQIASDHSAQASLQVSYDHQGKPAGETCLQKTVNYVPTLTYSALMNMCFWDYLRLYVPAGGVLIDASRFPIPAKQMLNHTFSSGEPHSEAEGDKEVFSSFFVVDLGEHKDVQFRYSLPKNTIQPTTDGRWVYSLYWQKQPGSPVITVNVVITLPPGSVAMHTRPLPSTLARGESGSTGQQLSYALDLAADTTVQVEFR